MNKRNSGITKRLEAWTVNKGRVDEKIVVKIAVRERDGRFNGATNFAEKRG